MFQTTVAREILYRKLEHTFYVQFTELMCQNGQLQLHVIPNFFLSSYTNAIKKFIITTTRLANEG